MVNRWNAIVGRLHEESGLQYPLNSVRKILDACVDGGFNKLEDDLMDTVFNMYLQTCSGEYLDLRGEELGVSRDGDEDDDSYRQRLFNALSVYLSVQFVKLQGIIIYSRENIEDNVRLHCSSRNPYMNNEYIGIPKTNIAQDFLINDVIYDDVIEWCRKGWE